MTLSLVASAGALLLARRRSPARVANRRLTAVESRRRTARPAPARPSGASADRLTPWVAVAAVPIAAWALTGVTGLVVSLALAPVVHGQVKHLVAGTRRGRPSERDGLPLVFDLIALALRAGAPVALALGCGAAHGSDTVRAELDRVAGLLNLGATPAEAWRSAQATEVLAPLAAVAMRSADSGIRMADGLDRRAVTLREEIRTAAVVRAERVGIMALLPLGFCFLPAFVCLGVLPIIAGVATDVFGRLAP